MTPNFVTGNYWQEKVLTISCVSQRHLQAFLVLKRKMENPLSKNFAVMTQFVCNIMSKCCSHTIQWKWKYSENIFFNWIVIVLNFSRFTNSQYFFIRMVHFFVWLNNNLFFSVSSRGIIFLNILENINFKLRLPSASVNLGCSSGESVWETWQKV